MKRKWLCAVIHVPSACTSSLPTKPSNETSFSLHLVTAGVGGAGQEELGHESLIISHVFCMNLLVEGK